MPTSPFPKIQSRVYSAAHFALELEGKKDIGIFRSIEGGGIKAPVMTYQGGANYDRWRQLGKPSYEDIKLQVAASMSSPFYSWLENFTRGKPDRRDGAILAADFHYKERARREFKNAMIKELAFPKLDGNDKNAAYMNITLAVEDIIFLPGTGQELPAAVGNAAWDNTKMWNSCNFRVSMDGFGKAAARCQKVDAFTIKQNVIEYHMGGRRAPIKTPSQIDFPQLSIYVPEPDAGPFIERFKERGVDGKQRSGSADKKSGEIITWDNENKDLFSLQFFGADICNVQPDKSDASSEEIKLVKIDIYTERMTFEYKQ